MQSDIVIDASDLRCPIPLARTKQCLLSMQSGQVLQLISTDPSTELDIKAFVAVSGECLLASDCIAGKYHFFLQKC